MSPTHYSNKGSHHLSKVSDHVWHSKYQRDKESSIEETWDRVSRALSEVEANAELRESWRQRFRKLLDDFQFLPAGRILAGAGTHHTVTLFNCFVMGIIPDDMDGIFESLKEGARTMQQGGGVGYDFSTLRPRGTEAAHAGTIASGPVSFMKIWNAMCDTILSTGARRGAMMATLRCDHPDIEEFIESKRGNQLLNHFNISVLASDAFIEAVKKDKNWDLVFPVRSEEQGDTTRRWTGSSGEVPCQIHKTVRARDLWQNIMQNTYDHAEPGVLFIDRINEENNLHYQETITATNPCGEIPLPPYGACDLGSFNLARFVEHSFTSQARFDFQSLRHRIPEAVRLLDNVIDASRYPLKAQEERARSTRRIGLGVTGLADALARLNLHYDSNEGREFFREVMEVLRNEAYNASINLAQEKGSFPDFAPEKLLESRFASRLPSEIRDGIQKRGLRNSHLLAIAPTGTISLLANNLSSGIEPIFSLEYTRQVLRQDGNYEQFTVQDAAYADWKASHHTVGHSPLSAPSFFTTALELPPKAHLLMQCVAQPYIDSSISKTINIPANFPFSEFKDVYMKAFDWGAKGCTTFRPNPSTGELLSESPERAKPCCDIEREGD